MIWFIETFFICVSWPLQEKSEGLTLTSWLLLTVLNLKCVCCCDNGIGKDSLVLKEDCEYCNLLSSDQKAQLATPSYKSCKEKKTATSQIIDPESITYCVWEVDATSSEKSA